MSSRSLRVENIASRILLLRGHKVMLVVDLADLYGAPTRALVRAVKRNCERFPPDFMFQLTEQEVESLKSQSGEGLGFAVEGMAVAGDLWSYPNESCSPELVAGRKLDVDVLGVRRELEVCAHLHR